MARIELRTFIRAPRERVWGIITDLSGQHRWMEDVHRLEVVSEVRTGVGTLIDVTSKLFGLPVLHDVMEIVTWDEPRELEVVHGGGFTGSGRFSLEEALAGTIFIWEEVFNPPLGPLGELAATIVVAPHLRRVWARSMDNVRRLAEAGYPRQPKAFP